MSLLFQCPNHEFCKGSTATSGGLCRDCMRRLQGSKVDHLIFLVMRMMLSQRAYFKGGKHQSDLLISMDYEQQIWRLLPLILEEKPDEPDQLQLFGE